VRYGGLYGPASRVGAYARHSCVAGRPVRPSGSKVPEHEVEWGNSGGKSGLRGGYQRDWRSTPNQSVNSPLRHDSQQPSMALYAHARHV
jgi:hypothetical protein